VYNGRKVEKTVKLKADIVLPKELKEELKFYLN
jgi:hypothetical protein